MNKEFFLKKNLGTTDRLLRLSIAIVLLIYALLNGSVIAFLGSLFVFYEAFASWCLFYQLIGKSSCPIDRKKD
jgi:hypothetical protein